MANPNDNSADIPSTMTIDDLTDKVLFLELQLERASGGGPLGGSSSISKRLDLIEKKLLAIGNRADLISKEFQDFLQISRIERDHEEREKQIRSQGKSASGFPEWDEIAVLAKQYFELEKERNHIRNRELDQQVINRAHAAGVFVNPVGESRQAPNAPAQPHNAPAQPHFRMAGPESANPSPDIAPRMAGPGFGFVPGMDPSDLQAYAEDTPAFVSTKNSAPFVPAPHDIQKQPFHKHGGPGDAAVTYVRQISYFKRLIEPEEEVFFVYLVNFKDEMVDHLHEIFGVELVFLGKGMDDRFIQLVDMIRASAEITWIVGDREFLKVPLDEFEDSASTNQDWSILLRTEELGIIEKSDIRTLSYEFSKYIDEWPGGSLMNSPGSVLTIRIKFYNRDLAASIKDAIEVAQKEGMVLCVYVAPNQPSRERTCQSNLASKQPKRLTNSSSMAFDL